MIELKIRPQSSSGNICHSKQYIDNLCLSMVSLLTMRKMLVETSVTTEHANLAVQRLAKSILAFFRGSCYLTVIMRIIVTAEFFVAIFVVSIKFSGADVASNLEPVVNILQILKSSMKHNAPPPPSYRLIRILVRFTKNRRKLRRKYRSLL